jgi:HK97 family phage major capsid protein
MLQVQTLDFNSLTAEQRALSATTGSAGAFTIPESFQYTLDVAMKYYGGLLEAADYIDTDTGQLMPYPTMNDTANSGENIAESATVMGATGGATEQDPSFGVFNFSGYMFDSGIVKLPMQLIQDSAFDIETWLTDALRVRMGRRLNAQATNGAGAGSSQLTGIATAAPVGSTAASATAIAYNDLLNAEHAVDPAYRRNGTVGWMFNDQTFRAIKALVDGNGRPLFLAGGVTQGISERAPDTLMGYPIFINQDLPNIAASASPMLFGNFQKYKIRRVGSAQMVRFNELFMVNLQVGFLIYQRFDGNLIDAGTHPVVKVQMAAS